jgi:hypothetical protein
MVGVTDGHSGVVSASCGAIDVTIRVACLLLMAIGHGGES